MFNFNENYLPKTSAEVVSLDFNIFMCFKRYQAVYTNICRAKYWFIPPKKNMIKMWICEIENIVSMEILWRALFAIVSTRWRTLSKSSSKQINSPWSAATYSVRCLAKCTIYPWFATSKIWGQVIKNSSIQL